MKIRSFIVGLGNIGMLYDYKDSKNNNYLSHAQTLNNINNFQLIGAYDNDKKKRKSFEKKFLLKTFDYLDYSLLNLKPELIIIATPTQSHLSVIKKILIFYKPKIILCEKPLSYNLKDAHEIINICKLKNIKLYVNYVRLSDPKFINVTNNIQKNTYVAPVIGTVWYSDGFLNNGSHFFNLFEKWFGEFKSSKRLIKRKKFNKYDFKNDYLISFAKAQIYFLSSNTNIVFPLLFDLYFLNGNLKLSSGDQLSWNTYKKKTNKLMISKYKHINKSDFKYQMHVYKNITKKVQAMKISSGNNALKTLTNMLKVIKND